MEKRESSRSIIISDNNIVLMYREKGGKTYYTFPGGGKESGETDEQCVIRETLEEFGLLVKPLREVFCYEDSKSVQHFFLCERVSGEFGSGKGEEYQPGSDGVYIPKLVSLNDLNDLPLMPPEAKNTLLENMSSILSDTNFFKSITSDN